MTKKELLDGIIGYKLDRKYQYGYEKCYLSLQFTSTWGHKSFGLEWQRNTTGGTINPEPDGQYYAGHISVSMDNLEITAGIAKLLQSLFDNYYIYNMQPDEAISALESAGIKEVQYHQASGQFYTKEKWPIKASYKLMSGNTYEKHLFADSEQEAIAEGIKYAAANAHRASMQQWLKDQTVEFLASPEEWQEDRPLLKAS
jgi:hypothetical protein